eukprot:TRINITY_DN731_c9_g1_i1.p1 TRINITY_DN731_c9_g1~~TRINITY_DN731_c9_g1_i1.p1  ORF type:complete len:497 (+),score=103.11 TRINITY_DN731_c9_g1_i1:42-1532(+)
MVVALMQAQDVYCRCCGMQEGTMICEMGRYTCNMCWWVLREGCRSAKAKVCGFCGREKSVGNVWHVDGDGVMCSDACVASKLKSKKKVDKRRWERCESIEAIYPSTCNLSYCITAEETEIAAQRLLAWIAQHNIDTISLDTEGVTQQSKLEDAGLGLLQLSADGPDQKQGLILLVHLSRFYESPGSVPTLVRLLANPSITKSGSGLHETTPDVLRLGEAGLHVNGLFDTVSYGETLSARAEGLGVEKHVRRGCGFGRTAPIVLAYFGLASESSYLKQKMLPCDWHQTLSAMHQRHAANNVWTSLLVYRYLRIVDEELGEPPAFLWVVRPSHDVLHAGGEVLRTANAAVIPLSCRRKASEAAELGVLSPLLPRVPGLKLVSAAHCTAPDATDSIISIQVSCPMEYEPVLRLAGDDVEARWSPEGTILAYTPQEVGLAHHAARLAIQYKEQASVSPFASLRQVASEASASCLALFVLSSATMPSPAPRHRASAKRRAG